MKRLATFVRAIEARYEPEADFHAVVRHEHALSPSLGGRSVFDDRSHPRSDVRSPRRHPSSPQLPLFDE